MNILSIKREDFFDKFFEKKFFFEQKAIKEVNISWEDIDEILFSWDPADGLISLFKNGKVDPANYTEQFYDVGTLRTRIIKDTFNKLMLDGATLVLNRVDTKSLKINKLTKLISHFLKEKTVSNGYAAFGGEGTFAKHWDTHDVFAIQLIGRKRWKLFEPTFPLPLRHQKSKDRKHECPQIPVFDEILEAGDILYIPRGWWHDAIPLDNEETFHIAVGMHPTYETDYFSWYANNILSQNVFFRKSLRLESENKFDNLDKFSILNDSESMSQFKKKVVSEDIIVSPFNLSKINKFSKLKNAESLLSSDKKLFLNTSYSTSFQIDNICINGININIDVKSRKILDLLSTNVMNYTDLLEKIGFNSEEERYKLINLINKLILNDIISEI